MSRESVAQSLETNRRMSSLDKNVRDLINVVKEHGENIRELFANSTSGASKAELLAAMTTIRTERAGYRGNGDGNGAPDILMDRILSLEKEKAETAKETKARIGNLELEVKQLRNLVYGMESKVSELKSMGSFKPSKPVESKVIETVVVQQVAPVPAASKSESAPVKEFVHKPLPTKKGAQIQEDEDNPLSPPKQLQPAPEKSPTSPKPKPIVSAPKAKPIAAQPQELSQKSTDSGGSQKSSTSVKSKRMTLGLPRGAGGTESANDSTNFSSSATKTASISEPIKAATVMKNEHDNSSSSNSNSSKTRMKDKLAQNALKNSQPTVEASNELVIMDDSTSVPGTGPVSTIASASASASAIANAVAPNIMSTEEELVQASISTIADSTAAIPTELTTVVDLENDERSVPPSGMIDNAMAVGNQSQNYHQMMVVSRVLEHKMETIESSLASNARRIDKTIEMVVSQIEATNRLRSELNSTYESIQADFDEFKARMHELDGQRVGKIDKVRNLVDGVEGELLKLNRRTTELHDAHHELKEHHRKTTLNMQIFGTPHVEVPVGYARGVANANDNQEYGKTGGYGRKMHLSVDPMGQQTSYDRPSTYGYDGEASHSPRGAGKNIHTANSIDSVRHDRNEYKKLVNEIHELKTGLLQQAAKFVTIGNKGENTTDRLKGQAQEIKQLRRELHSVRQILAATVGSGSPTAYNQGVSVVGISIDANNNHNYHYSHDHNRNRIVGYGMGVEADDGASIPDSIRTPALVEYGPGGLVTESDCNSLLIPDISNPPSIYNPPKAKIMSQQPQSDGTTSTTHSIMTKDANTAANHLPSTDKLDEEGTKDVVKPSIVPISEERQLRERLSEEVLVERRQYFNIDKILQNNTIADTTNGNIGKVFNKTGSKLTIYKKPGNIYASKTKSRGNDDSNRLDLKTPPVADTAWMTAYRFKEETQRPGSAIHAELNDHEELLDTAVNIKNLPLYVIPRKDEEVTSNNVGRLATDVDDPKDLHLIDSPSQKEMSIASGYVDATDSTDSHMNARPHPPSSPIGHGASHGKGARQGRALHPQEDNTVLSEELKKNTATILYKIPDFGTTKRE